jgi:ribose transport system permease protein
MTSETLPQAGTRLSLRQALPVAVGLAVVVLLLVLGADTPGFLTPSNGMTILRAASVTGIAAIGITFVTVSGNLVPLSTQGMATIGSVVYAMLVVRSVHWVLAAVLVLLLVCLIGLLEGRTVALGVNPIVTTLASGAALAGLAAVLTDLQTIHLRIEEAQWMGRAFFLGVPSQSLLFAVLAVTTTVLFLRSRLGRELGLVGSNAATAAASGLRPRLMTTIAFAVAAVCAGLAGLLQTAQMGQANAVQFGELTFNAIAAVLVGGVAIEGGRGTPLGAALGSFFIAFLGNLMFLRGASFGVQLAVQGAIVAIAIVLLMRRG